MTTALLTDLTDFVDSHRPYGPLTADATGACVEWLPAHGGVPVWGGV